MHHRLRIGLLGGSFNPAHAGHLHISLEAMKRLGLDEVWWLVSPGNPLKPVKDMLPYEKRFASAQKMAHGHCRIVVSDIEKRLGTRYTFDTVRALKRRFPRTAFVWMMGADNLAQLHRWRCWRALLRLLPFAILDRAPFSHTALRSKAALALAPWRVSSAKVLAGKKPPRWAYILLRRHPASSTAIRQKRTAFS